MKDAALVVSKAPASFLNVQEVLSIKTAIRAAEDKFGVGLELLVVDTVSRFLAPGDESKSQDMGAYLAAVDQLRGDATAISNHHPGHADPRRARGSSNWRGALDTEYTIEASGDVVTLTCQKMKDGEKPAPLGFRITPAPTRLARQDGTPVHSVVLVRTDAVSGLRRPTGKAQQNILRALVNRQSEADMKLVWTIPDMRKIGRDLGQHKNTARDAVEGLICTGLLTPTAGGHRLADGVLLHSMGVETGLDFDRLLALRAKVAGWLQGETLHGSVWRAGLPKTMQQAEVAHG